MDGAGRPMTVMELVHCNLGLVVSIDIQGIQYGSSLGSSACNRGRMTNLHSLHENTRLRTVKMAVIAVVPSKECILSAEG